MSLNEKLKNLYNMLEDAYYESVIDNECQSAGVEMPLEEICGTISASKLTRISKALDEMGFEYWLFDDIDSKGIGHPKFNPTKKYYLWLEMLKGREQKTWGISPVTAE